MPDTSIDAIISGVSGNTRVPDATWARVSELPDQYRKAQDFAYQQKLRNVFSEDNGGLPLDPKTGAVDFQKAFETLVQAGGAPAVEQASSLANAGLQQNRVSNAPAVQAALDGTDLRPQPPTTVLPPSTSRNGAALVAPPLARGGVVPPGQFAAPPSVASPQGDQPGSIVGLVSAAGIPDELAGPVINQISAMTKTDPNATLHPDVAPRVQQVIQAAAQRMKAGQPQQTAQPMAQAPANATPPVATQPVPVASPPARQPAQQDVPPSAASADPTLGGLIPAGYEPGAYLRRLQAIAGSGRVLPDQQKVLDQKIGAIQTALQPTNEMKNYQAAVKGGYRGSPADFATDQAGDAEYAKTSVASNQKRYDSLIENGTKAQQEIPQLEMLQQQMNDPNFFSGAGEKYNLLYKRLKSAVGIDPDAALPQEFLRKATAANVLSSLGALKGMGQIRVAEINMAREAAASPENSVPANKLLVEISKRTHERNIEIADMAANYNGGRLDSGFDKQLAGFYAKHPLFSDAEIKDWHKAITDDAAQPRQQAQSTPKTWTQQFASPRAATAAGAKTGDIITGPDGKPWKVR